MSLEFKIMQEEYNALLKRKEVEAEVDHEGKGTPSRIDLRKAIASKYGTKLENVYVVDIETKTGDQRAVCQIQVYDDPESAKRTVPRYIQIRNFPPEERKQRKEQEGEKAAKGKPEKPKEEKPRQESKPAPDIQKVKEST